MISIVTVYNDERILNDYLLKSLEHQTVKFELIKIDNTRNTFKSAAQALNYGGKKAKGKYIMFVHQDVDLCSRTWLEEAENVLDSLPNLGIAGVVGKHDGITINTIKWGMPPAWLPAERIKTPERVQTLDECLVIIPREIFQKYQFDEKACQDWHLYAVDYSLDIVKVGLAVFVIPMCAHHLSGGIVAKTRYQLMLSLGPYPKGYYESLRPVLKKHRKHIKRIYTTCGSWSTLYPLFLQRLEYLIRRGLRNFSKR